MNSVVPIYFFQDLAVVLVAAAAAAWACKRIGLSPIVGYLLAGIIVGTPQITFIYVTDPLRVQLLSQLGLVFLMFSIGLGFRIQRFKQLGLGTIAATLTTALLTLTLTRLAAGALGFGPGESLFFAAMLMISSSAVIGKTLQSSGLTHHRFGQLALGITLCEDIVAIVLLAFLGSYAAMDPASSTGWLDLTSKLGLLGAFVAILMLPGLIIVPRLLEKVSALKGNDHHELEILIVAGLLFCMAFLTLYSGYSLALGSFLCGMIVAESRRRRALSESFTGLRDIFAAVFFVAIGMSIDITRFPSALGLILLGSALALLLRPLAATTGLLLSCEDPKEATRAGLSLGPIGEFSFVIAALGIDSGILDERFRMAAVGISLVTTLLSPSLIQRSERVAEAISPDRFPLFRDVHNAYRNLWLLLGRRQGSSLIWRFLRPRIPQVGAEFLLVSALLVFSQPVFEALGTRISSEDPFFRSVYQYGYWIGVTLLALVPLLALARNINAIAMLLGEYVTQGLRSAPGVRRLLILLFRGIGLFALGVWIVNLIPFPWLSGYTLLGMAAAVLIALGFGWRLMVRLHSEATFALREIVNTESPAEGEIHALMQAKNDWGIRLEEWTLGDTPISGRTIGELQLRKRSGVTIVGIERHSHFLPSIGPATHLFSGDRLYLTGSEKQLSALRQIIEPSATEIEEPAIDYRDAILESGVVQRGSVAAGKELHQLQWPRLLGAQIVALRRGDEPPRSPEADETLQVGDALLLVGSPKALADALEQLAAPLPTPSDPEP